MVWNLPGTVLTIPKEDVNQVKNQFSSMFLGGGMVLSQVAAVTGLEPYTIQNWVKRGFLPPPEKKRYCLAQLCRVININMLKNVMSMDRICGLLGYVNGRLDDTQDDIIDDSALYFLFVTLAARLEQRLNETDRNALLEEALSGYEEPIPGAKKRVETALRIMLTAWLAARLSQEAERMLKEIQ